MSEKLWNPTEKLLREPAAPAGREELMVDRAQLAGVIGRKKLFSGIFANKVRPLNLSSDTSTVSLKHIHLHPYGLRVKAARVEISCRSSGVSKNQV